MGDDIIAYMLKNGLDADVFFTGVDGPIAPAHRAEWIANHEEAIDHGDIEYDDDTGLYNFSFQVPESAEPHYRNNRAAIEQAYADQSNIGVTYADDGVTIVGSVQDPGTACMMACMVEDAPELYSGSYTPNSE